MLDTTSDGESAVTVESREPVDASNAEFWDELCGSILARKLGVADATGPSLERFDRAYLELYPYLIRYLPWCHGERLLEVGLGYGTVGALLAKRGLDYHGLDISMGPVEMMSHRLKLLGIDGHASQGSALAIPYPDESFDVVVSIGCLHHTGNLEGSIAEVHRVLRRGGDAVLMVYNSHSYRRCITLPWRMVRAGTWRDRDRRRDMVRRAYDLNDAGQSPPVTEFESVGEFRHMLRHFAAVAIQRENCETISVGVHRVRLVIPRARLLGTVGRWAGLDLYATARK